MSVSKLPSSNAAPSAGASEPAKADPYAQIVGLARSASSVHEFFTKFLRVIADAFSSPYAAISVSVASEVIEDDWHTGATDPGFWKSSLQEFLTDSLQKPGARARLLNPKRGTTKVAFLSAPILDSSGARIGATALVVTPVDEGHVVSRLAVLESLTTLASHLAAVLRNEAKRAQSPAAPASAQVWIQAAKAATGTQLAFAITNGLRNRLGCEQVALGMVVGRRVKIVSISGLDHAASRTPGIVPLQAAMEECLDIDRFIVCQEEDASSPDRLSTGHRLHRQWRAAANGDAIASIPLHVEGQTVAILSLRRRPDQPFTTEHIASIRTQVEPYAAVLLLAHKADRGLIQHTRDRLRDAVRTLFLPGRAGTKILTAACAVALAWFALGRVDYQLVVPCKVAAGEVRHVAMPYDGVLGSATVVAGDRVHQGDLLCGLDQAELAEQRAELLAELAVVDREGDRALGANEPVNVQLAQAKRKLLDTRIKILDSRIQQASLRAPIDGIVVAGDLRKHVGGVLAKGDALFQVAPLEQLILELQVPEADVDDLALGRSGTFAPHARPEQGYPLRVRRICPHAELVDGKNVFLAEADVKLPLDWIRPGMEGVAKVQVGRRVVWWVVLHRAIDYLRLKLWL